MAGMYQKTAPRSSLTMGSGMCRVGFTGYDALCVMFPSGVAKPKMLSILAGMDQIMVQTAETVVVPQLQSIQVVDIPLVPQRQFPMVQTVQQTTEIPQMPFRVQVVDAPVVQVVLAIPVVVNDRCARLRLCSEPSRSRSCSSSSSSTIPCCGAEADSHGLRLVFFFRQCRRHPCRGADTDFRGPLSPQRFSSCSTLIR